MTPVELQRGVIPCSDAGEPPGHAVVAMSGGVDSSVAAALMLQQGFRVTGMTMKLFDAPDDALSDPARDAKAMAEALGIPHVVLDLRDEFRGEVIDPFMAEYRQGRTPNPCARCNRAIKFGRLLNAAMDIGGDFLVTGHYARIMRDDSGCYHLLKGLDSNKDQSYFLFSLGQQELSRVRFPLGSLHKKEVKELAATLGLACAEKGESQEICFVPHDDYIAFMEREGAASGLDGDIVHVSGAILGRHQGIHRYTVGQRRGLGIAWTEPLYVVRIDAPNRQVVVGERTALERNTLSALDVSWVAEQPAAALEAECRIRYRHRAVPCSIRLVSDTRADVVFASPERGITPGQAAVFYRGDELLGGGWIE